MALIKQAWELCHIAQRGRVVRLEGTGLAQAEGEDSERPQCDKDLAVLPHFFKLALSPWLMTKVHLSEPGCL